MKVKVDRMIFLELSPTVFSTTNQDWDHIELRVKYRAYSAFEYKDGKTHYFKNRWQVAWDPAHQYTSEEMIILTLKATAI
jgi:hypothetical protein